MERNAKQIERFEHGNKQLKTQMSDMQDYQRLKKSEDDALKKSEAPDNELAWQMDKPLHSQNFVWEIHNTSGTLEFHLKSPLYSLPHGYKIEIHIQSTYFLDIPVSFGLHFEVTRRDFEASPSERIGWMLFDWPIKLRVRITVLGKGLLNDYSVVITTIIQKPANIKDCSTFVRWHEVMSYQDFSKYYISCPILIEVGVDIISFATQEQRKS